MRIMHIVDRTARASRFDRGAQIDSRNAFHGEVRQKQVVFGRPAWILRPKRQVVLINARGARRGATKKRMPRARRSSFIRASKSVS